MSQMYARVGPIALSPGVRKFNFWTFMYASFICIAMLAGVNFLQIYLIEVNLSIPKNEQGSITGLLAFAQELVALALIVPFGLMSDRIGRRPVMVAGLLICGVGYALFPLAATTTELVAYRVLFAIGSAALAAMLAIVGNDYTQERSRGRLFGFGGVMNGLGVIFMSAGLAQIPGALESAGFTPRAAGTVMFLTAATLCVLSALWLQFGLQGGVPVAPAERQQPLQLLIGGMRAGLNPRVFLSYLASFAGRSDNSIKSLFVAAWVIQVAPQLGVSAPEAIGRAGMLMGLMGVVSLVWTPLFGLILDRLNRVTGLGLAMGLAAGGFLIVSLVSSPLENSAIPAFALLAIGQSSAIIASVTLVGQEADPAARGTIIATNGWFGAMGILVASVVGGMLFDAVGPYAPFAMIGIFQAGVMLFAVAVRIKAPGSGMTASAAMDRESQ